jgi:hypothetical protein
MRVNGSTGAWPAKRCSDKPFLIARIVSLAPLLSAMKGTQARPGRCC